MTEKRLLWTGLVVTLLGLAFLLGWFFVPPAAWLDDPGFAPMPEALLGWWVIAIGVVLLLRGWWGRGRR